jgi:hypothetical protein
VLLYINSGMPIPPSPRRCYGLGRVLADYVAAQRPSGERTVVIGLGGLSHWLRMPGEGTIATDFDETFLALLERGEAQAFAERTSCDDIAAAAGNGGLEILSWLTAAGSCHGGRGERIFYEPIAQWITGVGAVELLAGPALQEA